MIKSLALNRLWPAGSFKSQHRVINAQSQTSHWRLWLSIGLIAANSLLLLSYIYGVNQFASQGYEITVMQQRLTGLNSANKQLNLKLAQETSMVGIQNDFSSAGYVLASTPQFIQSTQYTMR